MLTNLFWTQRAENEPWVLQLGQIDVTDFGYLYGGVSPYTGFQNLSFHTSPTIYTPNQGLGIAAGVKLGSNFYAVGSHADANAALPRRTLMYFQTAISLKAQKSDARVASLATAYYWHAPSAIKQVLGVEERKWRKNAHAPKC